MSRLAPPSSPADHRPERPRWIGRFAVSDRVLLAGCAAFIAGYFLWFSSWGLQAGLTMDDLMNLWKARSQSVPELVRDSVLFFKFAPSYRPFGALFYHLMYSAFGYEEFPYRVACHLLLLVNNFLLYAVVRRLAGSREVGILAALLFSYHYAFSTFYLNTGTCFDLWCFFFFYLAFLQYLRVRQRDDYPGWRSGFAICGLFILALSSKEIAVVFPLILAAYELIYHGVATPRPAALLRQGRLVVLTGLMTLAFIVGRFANPDSISKASGYELDISAHSYLQCVATYLGQLKYADGTVALWQAATVLCVLLLAAALARSRNLLFGWTLLAAGVLPVAFIPPRALNAVYLALPGLALFVAAVLAWARRRVVRVITHDSRNPSRRTVRGSQVLLVVLVAFLAGRDHLWAMEVSPGRIEGARRESAEIRAMITQLKGLRPLLPPGTRALVLHDPFDGQEMKVWTTTFIVAVLYPDVTWDRLFQLEPKPTPEKIAASYDIVITSEGQRLIPVDPREAGIDHGSDRIRP